MLQNLEILIFRHHELNLKYWDSIWLVLLSLNVQLLTFWGLSWQSWNWDLPHINKKLWRQISILNEIEIQLFADVLHVRVFPEMSCFLWKSYLDRIWSLGQGSLGFPYMQEFKPMKFVPFQCILLFTGMNFNKSDLLLMHVTT